MANAHWPLAPMANGHWPFCCIKRYTSDTRGVKAFQSYTAKTALYSAIQYTAIHRYTLYNLYITLLASRRGGRPPVVVIWGQEAAAALARGGI